MYNRISLRFQNGSYGYLHSSNISGIVCDDNKCDVTFKKDVPRTIRTGCSYQQIQEFDRLVSELDKAGVSYDRNCNEKEHNAGPCNPKYEEIRDSARANFILFSQNNQCQDSIITRSIKASDFSVN
jgi:hypothetical protein